MNATMSASVSPVSPASPAELLAAADQMLSAPRSTVPPGVEAGARDEWDEWLSGHWPRTCALLIRLALEVALDGYWRRVAPSAAECSMRSQLLLLPQFTDDRTVLLAREAWLGLSRAAHHHAYELAPTAGELRTWHSDVSAVADVLA